MGFFFFFTGAFFVGVGVALAVTDGVAEGVAVGVAVGVAAIPCAGISARHSAIVSALRFIDHSI